VRANGGTPNLSTAFPICNSAKSFGAKLSKIEAVGQEALDLIKATKAYKGGNDGLWALRELDNADKHRLLITIAAAHHGVGIDIERMFQQATASLGVEVESPDFPPIFLQPAGDQFPLEDGDVLFRDSAEAAGTKGHAMHPSSRLT
jgi:hypothetical protein